MLSKDLLPGVPLVESPFFGSDASEIANSEHLRVAREINEKGFAIIEFPDPQLNEKIESIRSDFQHRYDWDGWRKKKISSLRIQDAWQSDQRVQSIAANQEVIDLLSVIYGRRAFPFQTLNFAVGTQQPGHSDHAHFNSVPDRFMCGVWVAFEDVDEENGPLFYYPGTHKWPSYQNEHLGVPYTGITAGYPEYKRYVTLWNRLAETQGLSREVFKAKQGQALIWAANLLHGGSIQTDLRRTRWSQVTHYFFEGCAYTTPVANDVYQGRVHYRTVKNLATGAIVPNTLNGEAIRETLLSAIRKDFKAAGAHATDKMKIAMEKGRTSNFRNSPHLPVDFDPQAYLRANADVLNHTVDPYEHYVTFGRFEKRRLQ